MADIDDTVANAPERVIADLFLDSIIDAPVKDDTRLMAYPFFSLKKMPRFKPIIYVDEKSGQSVEVRPGERGIATIWDKDILMYAVSLVVERLNRGQAVDRTIQFNAYDLLTLTYRGTGGEAYQRFFDALFRLRSTTIVTSIDTGRTEETQGFGWIDSFKIVSKTTKRGRSIMGAVEITLADWMWRALQSRKKVITINRDYFKLTKGLERKLYELARKHVGGQAQWCIRLENLARKCGTESDLRFFKRDLKTIIAADRLPDYEIGMAFDAAEKAKFEKVFGAGKAWRWGSNARIIVTFTPRFRGITHS